MLLLRLTQKRFSATQYALLSSLFTLPRVLAGPITGVLADAMGWRDFFVLTVLFGVPGMVMLARFVPWGARDVNFEVAAPSWGPPISRNKLGLWSALGGAVALLAGLGGLALVAGLTSLHAGRGFRPGEAIAAAWSRFKNKLLTFSFSILRFFACSCSFITLAVRDAVAELLILSLTSSLVLTFTAPFSSAASPTCSSRFLRFLLPEAFFKECDSPFSASVLARKLKRAISVSTTELIGITSLEAYSASHVRHFSPETSLIAAPEKACPHGTM